MLRVKTPDEVLKLIETEFDALPDSGELVPLDEAVGRVLGEDIVSSEYVPDFNRSTVDGYAVRARDTFGCSDAIPAIIPVCAQVLMGEGADFVLPEEACCYVPTGGAIPEGADCCVMIEYTEDYGDRTVGILKPGAPGQNMIFRGDDVFPGKLFLNKGRVLGPRDIGALSAAGIVSVPVVRRLRVGIVSTGDELVPPEEKPKPGQVRDVNSHMLAAMLKEYGAESVNYGIVVDDEQKLSEMMKKALGECDVVLVSGGSSVGVKDATCRIIESLGELLLHGIAMKPGKPTIMGRCGSKPLVGLPGHPVAAYFVTELFVLPLLGRLSGREERSFPVPAKLSESVGANHGRAQYGCVHLQQRDGALIAVPVRTKSGLVTALAGSDGFFCIDRDCEGLPADAEIQVTVC